MLIVSSDNKGNNQEMNCDKWYPKPGRSGMINRQFTTMLTGNQIPLRLRC